MITTPTIPLKLKFISALVLLASFITPASAVEKTVSESGFKLVFDSQSQTLLSMKPETTNDFDFLPYAHKGERQGDGYYQLGDIDLRIRTADGHWQDYSTAYQTRPVTSLEAKGTLLSADITPDLPGIPLSVSRSWKVQAKQLILEFSLKNTSTDNIEVGGLGIAMVFDNILSGRELDKAHEKASYAEPYMGMDAGYVQVVRLNGKGPVLLVMPEKKAPLSGWMPILDNTSDDGAPILFNDPTPRTHTFEGFYDWMVFTGGFADTTWKGKTQWNPPQSLTLEPGETYKTALRFTLSPSVRDIENTLSEHQQPVVVGLPGYVIPQDLPGKLYIKAPEDITKIKVEPAQALTITPGKTIGKWAEYDVAGHQWGRSRLTVTYADKSQQTIHYFVTRPMAEAVADMGKFLFNEQWYEDKNDVFQRSPSIMSYDNSAKQIIQQEQRVWLAGLSDEAGAGSWLAAIMKQLGQPEASEIAKFERFYNEVIDGHLQINKGPNKYGVKKSLFFYDPKSFPDYEYDNDLDWTTWASWSKEQADSVVRSYNYPHVAAAQWVLYRLARFHQNLVSTHNWQTYLTRASETALAMADLAPQYAQFGQMEGSVFVAILEDLYAEGMTEQADKLKAVMKARADHWASLAYPFGSEMPWDSTGQEEVYAWMRYFSNTTAAEMTREVILGYDFTLPHWGYNGSARRFWDFLYAGKDSRIERQLHHYGSTLNATPLLDSFRRDPEDIYLLRVGYGGIMGGLTNIHENGFASAAFHSFPDYMDFDPYTGDYGSSFFGYAFNIGGYLIKHPVFGWQGFGGKTTASANKVNFMPKDAFRNRVYIGPAKLWLTLDAGKFTSITWDAKNQSISVSLDAATQNTPEAMLSIQAYDGRYIADHQFDRLAGRLRIPLDKTTEITLKPAD